MKFQELLAQGPLLFDGSMGTYYAEKTKQPSDRCELANLQNPKQVSEIHREYLNAGCMALKTNTFSVNRPFFAEDEVLTGKLIDAGWTLAADAAVSADALVFADIGPIRVPDTGDLAAEYRFLADRFLTLGATHFLFETNPNNACLLETADYIRSRCPESVIICSFAATPDGFTREGLLVSRLLRETSPHVSAVGLNCIAGAQHMLELVRSLEHKRMTLSVMPNAGYPTVLGNRTFYGSDPDFYAEQLALIAAEGVSILGGCCGTTPVHMRKTAEALRLRQNAPIRVHISSPSEPASIEAAPNPFWEKLQAGLRPIAVELDPPENADAAKFLSGAAALRDAGVDAVTIADCPVAHARMDSSLLACKLHRELGIDPIPHMTCRDRNLNAIKALLLGLNMEGVQNILLVTGDPIPSDARDEVKSVYNFNSRMLAGYLSELNRQVLPSPFRIFGALNLNAPNFSIQLSLAKQKVENGVSGFLTQPVLTQRAGENLQRAKEELDAKILGGMIPLVSYRNACYINSEIAGITVDPEIIARYEGKDRDECEALAIELTVEIAKKIAPYCDGYYLITPFQRVGLIARILREIQTP